MTSYSLDAESFINEVKKYPEIWHLNSEGNKHRFRKHGAWAEVAKVFIPDLDSMSEADKFEVFRKLHSKWRNIRDAYVRNLKRADGKRAYMYAKQLSFLNAVYLQNACQSENESSDEETKKRYRTRQIEVNTSSLDDNHFQSDEESSSTIDNFKRRRLNKTENIEFVNTPTQNDLSYQVEDGDRSFFDSVLPAVREFNMDQKLEFRSEVLRLIKSIRCNPMYHDIKIDQVIAYGE